jgi:hypothetical protein
MKNKAMKPVNFVRRHKVAVAIVGTAVICIYINRQALAQHNDFLMEKGLFDEFYAMGME